MNHLLAFRASKSLRVQAGGAGVRRRVRVFLYYHHTPHNFFRHKRLTARHKLPQRTLRIAVSPRDPRIVVSVAR